MEKRRPASPDGAQKHGDGKAVFLEESWMELFFKESRFERLPGLGFSPQKNRGDNVGQNEWDWPISTDFQKHNERVALMRPILYEMIALMGDPSASAHQGKALSVNISSGGMLVLMEQAPAIEQVMKVYVPTPMTAAETPTLAEVRWTRKLPFGRSNGEGPYFVGLKFMF